MRPNNEDVSEFLKESNAIEGVYSVGGLTDAIKIRWKKKF